MGKLIVSLSPHAHGTDSVERNMYGVIIALVPALLVSFFYFGLGSLVVCATSIVSCVFFEWFINKFILKSDRLTIRDGSAVLTGLLLGFNLPSNLPIWIIVIGALVAIGVAKMTFGGLGCNIFNPALVGRCFLLISFPAQMTSWPVVGQLGSYLDATTAATPLSVMKTAIKSGDASVLNELPDSLHLLLGNNPMGGAGTIGEVCALALLVGLAYMLWKKIITWHIPVSIIATVFVFQSEKPIDPNDVFVKSTLFDEYTNWIEAQELCFIDSTLSIVPWNNPALPYGLNAVCNTSPTEELAKKAIETISSHGLKVISIRFVEGIHCSIIARGTEQVDEEVMEDSLKGWLLIVHHAVG